MTRMVRFGAVFAALFVIFAGAIAYAYEVSPMRVILVPGEGRSQATITVNNTRDRPLPIEMRVLRRHVAADGTQTFTPADDDFIVFPPQIQVPNGQSQAIRFQYVGTPEISTSQAYVVQVTEVAVSPPGFSGINVTYNFGVAVYVEPPRAVERLTVVSAQVEGGRIRFQVRNDGTRWALLNDNALAVEAGGQRVELGRDQYSERIDNPLIPPNSTRSFEMPIPELSGSGAATIRLRSQRG